MKTKTKPKIVATHPAGKNHQVLTVVGGDGGYCTQPCAQCPWRVDQTGSFPASAFKHSASTAYNMAGNTFACHMAGAERPKICAGFLLNGSAHNMAVRMKLIKGEIDVGKVSDGGVELHESYRDMAVANGVRASDPVLRGMPLTTLRRAYPRPAYPRPADAQPTHRRGFPVPPRKRGGADYRRLSNARMA